MSLFNFRPTSFFFESVNCDPNKDRIKNTYSVNCVLNILNIHVNYDPYIFETHLNYVLTEIF